ncbi:MAG: transglutaminase family protein, partial [Acidimicrobiales bacterium]|nr:transglutaminase family protein [Acidimicrobiales bacterium]
ALVARPDVPLAEACLEAASHLGHPVGVAEGTAALDALAVEVGERCGTADGPPALDRVVAVLCDELGFAGDPERYYDLRNSMLGDVLARRRGIPITLAVVVIEVAERLGAGATGVGMPGHFLVGDGPVPSQWFDPFAGPAPIDAAAARARFRSIHGDEVAFDPAFLRPTPAPQIVGRVLANAAGVLQRGGDPRRLLRALELRSEIPGVGTTPRARVELAEAYRAVGRVGDAVATLEAVRDQVDPRRRAVVDERIARLRAALS